MYFSLAITSRFLTDFILSYQRYHVIIIWLYREINCPIQTSQYFVIAYIKMKAIQKASLQDGNLGHYQLCTPSQQQQLITIHGQDTTVNPHRGEAEASPGSWKPRQTAFQGYQEWLHSDHIAPPAGQGSIACRGLCEVHFSGGPIQPHFTEIAGASAVLDHQELDWNRKDGRCWHQPAPQSWQTEILPAAPK